VPNAPFVSDALLVMLSGGFTVIKNVFITALLTLVETVTVSVQVLFTGFAV
jgi:hypothetical protein